LRSASWARALLIATSAGIAVAGCGPMVGSSSPESSELGFPSIQGVDLVGPVSQVLSGEQVVLAAQTRPPTAGVTAALETFGDAGWVQTAIADTDDQGSATWSVPAPSAAGVFQLRAVIQDGSGVLLTSSNVVIISVALAPSSLDVLWPRQPLAYCEKADVAAIGLPSDVGRIVRLEARQQGRAAEIIDVAQLDTGGRASLRIPACPLSGALFAEPHKWRVVMPEVESAEAFNSPWTSLRIGEPPISCPSPQSIGIYADNPDFRASYFEVSNPSSECTMSFTVTAEFFCAWDGPDVDGFILGTKTSTPYSVPPSDTLTFITEEVFSNSAATCRDRIPPGNFGGLEFNLDSVSARAIGFEPAD